MLEILAKILGLSLFLFSFVLLFNRQTLKLILRLMKSREFLAFSGFLFLFFGIIIVSLHNEWSLGREVVVTVLGWLFILEGLMRVSFPTYFAKTLRKTSLIPIKISLWFTLALGAYLIAIGFF